MLFLKMCPGVPFSGELVAEVNDAIARECSKRHVPRFTFETPEIPVSCPGRKPRRKAPFPSPIAIAYPSHNEPHRPLG